MNTLEDLYYFKSYKENNIRKVEVKYDCENDNSDKFTAERKTAFQKDVLISARDLQGR